jgi:hypothetical protein
MAAAVGVDSGEGEEAGIYARGGSRLGVRIFPMLDHGLDIMVLGTKSAANEEGVWGCRAGCSRKGDEMKHHKIRTKRRG